VHRHRQKYDKQADPEIPEIRPFPAAAIDSSELVATANRESKIDALPAQRQLGLGAALSH
jgi:hypothetical protein